MRQSTASHGYRRQEKYNRELRVVHADREPIPVRIRKSVLTENDNPDRDHEAMREATRKGLHMNRSGD